jgi:hypothetical protein
MTVNIDLKPLSEEVIKQMGYDESNLWLIKIGSVVFGPFETQTLKHYVKDNEHLFEKAEASLANETKWKPFWSHTKFERRKLEAITKVNSDHYDGPFWIIDFGLKTGPFTHKEIDKKIEMGLMSVTDHISIDNGNNWIKVYQVKGFDRRTRTPEELPLVPFEAKFETSEENQKNKKKSDHQTTIIELADLTWQGIQEEKTSKFNLEEMNWKQEQSKFGSFIKWAVPGFALATIGFGLTSIILFSSLSERSEVTGTEVESKRPSLPQENRAPSSVPGLPKEPQVSSVNVPPPPIMNQPLPNLINRRQFTPPEPGAYRPPPPVPAPQSKYPTQVITHENNNIDPPPEDMTEPPDRPEPSLVGQDDPPDAPPEVEVPPPAPEVMEESSDF